MEIVLEKKAHRVFIVGAPPLVRAVRGVLRDASIEIAAETHSLTAAIPLIPSFNPELVICCARADDLEDGRWWKSFKTTCLLSEVLVLAPPLSDDEMLLAIGSGTRCILETDCDGSVLVGAISAMRAGGYPVVEEALARPRVAAAIIRELSALRLMEEWSQRGRTPEQEATGLTSRERDVLNCVCRGMSNAEIAGYLNIREQTVKNELNSTYRKLKVNKRALAVDRAIRLGIHKLPSANATGAAGTGSGSGSATADGQFRLDSASSR